jgi:hypothetical protein
VLYNKEVSAGSVNVGWSNVVVWISSVVNPSRDVVYVSRWLLVSVQVRFSVKVGWSAVVVWVKTNVVGIAVVKTTVLGSGVKVMVDALRNVVSGGGIDRADAEDQSTRAAGEK